MVKAPRGTRDLLPGEVEKWQFVECVARDICETYGFKEIRTPIFEHTELFLRGIGDATDIVAPTVEGPAAAMTACLADAGLSPEDVDYVNAHGTGTKANDQIETAAIKRVFGDHAYKMSVSSTKSMHAHCMGASGGLEMIACVMAIREGLIPPTANYREPDPQCDLDVTPNVARERPVRAALSNAFAFGGTNAVLAFKAV